MAALTAPRIWVTGETVTAAINNAEIRNALENLQKLYPTYVGTPPYGTYSTTKTVYRQVTHESGTSDGTNGLFVIAVPTATCILTANILQFEPGTAVSLIYARSDLFSATAAVFQTHLFTGAAVISKAYDVVVTVEYQI